MKPKQNVPWLSGWVVAVVLSVNLPSAYAAYTTVLDNGPSLNRVDVVFLGDGYTASDIAAGHFQQHVADYIDYMFTNSQNSEPFYRYRNFFNIHTIDVVSNQSGADIPPEGVFRNTALDAKYFGDGQTERLLTINDSKANAARNAALVGAPFTAEMQYITVNASKYGGSGGGYAVFAGGNSSASEIALHEIAHSFSNLADEYGGNPGTYTGAEPSEVNVTKSPSGAKWSRWIGYQQAGIGAIGAYQGGNYYDAGIYRPSYDSKMRSLSKPFDAVSREKIILDIYKKVNPFDSWTINSAPLIDPGDLLVDLVDDNVINVEWFVDDVLIPAATGTSFALSEFGYGPGDYSVTARGYDPTAFDPVDGWVRTSQQMLEQFVTWQVTLSASTLSGDFDTNGIVDGNDFLVWQRNPEGGDLADWKADYGKSAATGSSVVPEPTGWVLLFPLAIGMGCRRHIAPGLAICNQ